jgi:glycosyltransferase involved in cell wall biosynthesis
MDISVILCTFNRSDRLATAVPSLVLGSEVSSTTIWELLVIDNSSTDQTRAVAEEFGRRWSDRVRYLFEPRRGRSYALNTGIAQARGGIVAITDDDCIVDRRWLATILEEYKADADLAVLGGRVELFNPADRPVAVRNSKERRVISNAAFDPCYVPIIGCNVAYKKEALREIGGFDPVLGTGGYYEAVAEDMDLLYRAYKRGLKIVYSPEVLVYHDHGRRTAPVVRAVQRTYARGRGAFYCKHMLKGDIAVAKMAYEEGLIVTKDWTAAVLSRKAGEVDSTLRHLIAGAMCELKAWLGSGHHS